MKPLAEGEGVASLDAKLNEEARPKAVDQTEGKRNMSTQKGQENVRQHHGIGRGVFEPAHCRGVSDRWAVTLAMKSMHEVCLSSSGRAARHPLGGNAGRRRQVTPGAGATYRLG